MARLVVNGKPIEMKDNVVTIGRDNVCTIVVDDKECSRTHCKIERSGENYTVTDELSRNGMKVNGTTVNCYKLKHGDTILIGKTTIKFELHGDAPAKEPIKPKPSTPLLSKKSSGLTERRTVISAERAEELSEQKLLRYILVGGSIFIGLIVFMVLVNFIASLFQPSPTMPVRHDPPGDRPAQVKQAPVLDEEEQAYDKLREFYNANIANVDGVAEKIKDFKGRFPQTKRQAILDEMIQRSQLERDISYRRALEQTIKSVEDYLKSNEFSKAIVLLNSYIQSHQDSKYRKEAEDKRGSIVSAGVEYYKKEKARIAQLEQARNLAEARRSYAKLLSVLGDGKVQEFKDFCEAIEKSLGKL